MISIIDCGIGNVGSLQNLLKKINQEARVTSNHDELGNSDGLILPGVGSFDAGMDALKNHNLIGILNELVVQEKKPILGICIGMHLMGISSEEGERKGLGWFDATVTKLKGNIPGEQKMLRIPHMGWNRIEIKKDNPLVSNVNGLKFYFVHSYKMECHNADDVMFTTNYGSDFVSGISRGNIYGLQFHVEKSHKYGFSLMKNFCKSCYNV